MRPGLRGRARTSRRPRRGSSPRATPRILDPSRRSGAKDPRRARIGTASTVLEVRRRPRPDGGGHRPSPSRSGVHASVPGTAVRESTSMSGFRFQIEPGRVRSPSPVTQSRGWRVPSGAAGREGAHRRRSPCVRIEAACRAHRSGAFARPARRARDRPARVATGRRNMLLTLAHLTDLYTLAKDVKRRRMLHGSLFEGLESHSHTGVESGRAS